MTQYRDISIPYTAEEIAHVLETCKTFKSFDGNSIGTADFEIFGETLRHKRTPEQIQAYIDYFDMNLGGRLTLKDIEGVMNTQSTIRAHAAWYAEICDPNKNGVISKDEFENIYRLMSVQWPKVAGKSFDDFVREADSNKSSDVDIKEFINWLEELMK